MKSLLDNLKTNEFKAIHQCVGGYRAATGNPGDNNTPCTADSVDISNTPVAGQNGGTQIDYSNWKDECGNIGQPTSGWQTLPSMSLPLGTLFL